MCYIAYNPAAASIPVCLKPPPNLFLTFFALLINYFVPRSTEPEGQHKPLLKHNVIESV